MTQVRPSLGALRGPLASHLPIVALTTMGQGSLQEIRGGVRRATVREAP